MFDDKDVVRLLRSEVERAGGQSAWARRERIDRTVLNRVLRGHKVPTGEIIRALKLCNVYMPATTATPAARRAGEQSERPVRQL